MLLKRWVLLFRWRAGADLENEFAEPVCIEDKQRPQARYTFNLYAWPLDHLKIVL